MFRKILGEYHKLLLTNRNHTTLKGGVIYG